MDNDNKYSSKYLIDLEDPQLSQWHKIIDLDSALKLEPDWYSTKTFEAFLDALDVNQPISPKGKSGSAKSSIKNLSPLRSTSDTTPELKEDTSRNVTPKHQSTTETILSAEALKILSELPDLSHMSATRSFIYPQHDREHKKKVR